MSVCSPSCRKATGSRFEHCKVCHRTYGGHTLGDAHRVVSGSYVLAMPTSKSKPSTIQRFSSEDEVPDGWYLIPGLNTVYRCLTEDEMVAKGWRRVDNVWKGPQVDDEKLAKIKGISLATEAAE